jgi:hypothetical protein
MQPALHPNPQNSVEKHGIRIYLYKTVFSELPADVSKVSCLQDIGATPVPVAEWGVMEPETTVRVMRCTRPEKLAGSIATILQSGLDSGGSRCSVKAAGSVSVYR